MPQISVVVPSVNGFGDLSGCLEALEKQRTDVELEVLVVDRLGEELRRKVADHFPWVRIIDVEPGTPIPKMRAIGFSEATAPAVGVLEDHVLVRTGWAKAMLTAIEGGAHVVGGPIENAATDSTLDWASFLCEYSHCLPPLPGGEVDWVPGNNVVYSREILQEHAAVINEYRWENHLHDAVRRSGKGLICRPDIVVDHKKHFTFSEYMALRYQFSRSFAGSRVEHSSLVRRSAFALGSLLLPPILFFRTVTRIFSKGRHRGELMSSLLYIAAFVGAWSLGELVGYVAGPGDSLAKVT